MEVAEPIAQTPGLQWKIWLWNDEERIGAGIYLFEDQESIDAYLAGPIVAPLGEHPAISDLSVKVFDIVEKHTAVTRGPVGQTLTA